MMLSWKYKTSKAVRAVAIGNGYVVAGSDCVYCLITADHLIKRAEELEKELSSVDHKIAKLLSKLKEPKKTNFSEIISYIEKLEEVFPH